MEIYTISGMVPRIDSPAKINIDFSGISIISSSFADEFIGKMLEELGFFRFTKVVSLSGVSPSIEVIINRSVSQRMAAIYPLDSNIQVENIPQN